MRTYVHILSSLKQGGFEVFSDLLADRSVLTMDQHKAARRIFARDMKNLAECDLVVAEVTNTSFGVGFELCHALHLGKRVLCLYHRDGHVSRIIKGISMPGLIIREYGDTLQLNRFLNEFLDNSFECVA